MTKGFWFTSEMFQIQKGEDEETNPGCYGKALASWLSDQLKKMGYDVEEPIPEDWGWCVICAREEYWLWVGCVSITDNEDHKKYDPEHPPEENEILWHIFPEIEVPFLYLKSWLRKMTGRLNTRQPFEQLTETLERILKSEPKIRLCSPP